MFVSRRTSAVLASQARRLARGYVSSAQAYNHCVELVRHQDRERYLCNIYAPTSARPALFALHAFNLEVARVRGSTSEKQIGRMRLAWWRHTVRAVVSGDPDTNPVAQALAGAHARHGFTRRFLEQIVEAREADLEVSQPESMASLMTYCEQTAGALLQLGLEACGVPEREEAAQQQAPIATPTPTPEPKKKP